MSTVLGDHLRRLAAATRGFRYLGFRWLPVWLMYAFGPAIRPVWPSSRLSFSGFAVRTRSTDLYTYANLFEDYDVRLLDAALRHADLVVDAGANAGAFSWLALGRAASLGRRVRVVALEPDPDNFSVLAAQPFAARLECVLAAVGLREGAGRLQRGRNAATSTVAFEEPGNGECSDREKVGVLALSSLAAGSTLLKMDIEGGEWEALRDGVPAAVVAMFLECHPQEGMVGPADPRRLVAYGTWRLLSTSPTGATSWFWQSGWS